MMVADRRSTTRSLKGYTRQLRYTLGNYRGGKLFC